jgi:hypothetical protein
MFDRIPTIKYFKVFGCWCFVLNDKDDRGKFEAKSDEMIFVGYSSNSKAFRVYNRSTHQMTKSINVSFDEKGDMASESSRSEPVLTGVRVSEQLHSSAIQNDQASDLSNSQTDLDILFENFYNEYFEAPNQSASVSGVNANMPIQISDSSTEIPSDTTPDSDSSPIIISTDSSASTNEIFDTSDDQSPVEEVEEQ